MTPRSHQPVRVLLVCPRDELAASTVALLETQQPPRHRVLRAASGSEALRVAAEAEVDVYLLDGELGRESAHALVRELVERDPHAPFVLLANNGDRDLDLAAMHAGAADFLVRERLDADSLERSLRCAIGHARVKRDLQRSNDDLERFAAAVSHDLRQPLHLVSGYAELLAACCGDDLPGDARTAIQQILFGAGRMNELIEDLLLYARLGRKRRGVEAVDTAFLVELVERELTDRIQATHAVIERGLLPEVRGYRPLLEQLFRNLLGNALKFRGSRSPVVRVGAELRGDEWLFSVRDNGMGIPPAYQECIFEMFTRGPGRDEIEGTGIGLAICHKVVADHRGRIWVESEPGSGTSFFFTLPRGDG